MIDFFRRLFSSDFMPHGHCFFWRPEILWLHVSSDTLIVISYYLIPFALVYLVRKRRDLSVRLDVPDVRPVYIGVRNHALDGDLELVAFGLSPGRSC